MKKLIAALLVSLGLVFAPQAALAANPGEVMFVTITAAGTYDCSTDGGTTRIPCDLNPYPRVSVQVLCLDTCNGEVDLQQRNSPAMAFSGAVIQFINPGTADQGYFSAGAGQIQFVVQGGWTGTATISVLSLKS